MHGAGTARCCSEHGRAHKHTRTRARTRTKARSQAQRERNAPNRGRAALPLLLPLLLLLVPLLLSAHPVGAGTAASVCLSITTTAGVAAHRRAHRRNWGVMVAHGGSSSSMKQQQQQQQQQASGGAGGELSGGGGGDAGRARISPQDVQVVQNLIEKCLQLYMPQAEVMATLQAQAKIEPRVVGLVWQKLTEQNPDFFAAYHTRLKVKEQILLFNHLLDQQVALFQRLQRSWLQALPSMMAPMHRPPQMPLVPHSSTGISLYSFKCICLHTALVCLCNSLSVFACKQ